MQHFLELEEKLCPFADAEEMIQWMRGTFGSTMGVPWDISEAFFTDMFQRWVSFHPKVIDEEGRVYFQFNRLQAVATK